jgi:hypothetical protein
VPDRGGVRAAVAESHLALPRPPGSGDYVLMAEVSVGEEQRCQVTIAANGTPVLSEWVSGRRTIYGLLPRSAIAGDDAVDLAISSPVSSFGAPESQPAGDSTSHIMLHRAGVAAADPSAWVGYPNIEALLAELNAAQLPSDVHDLGWQDPGRAELIIPPGTTGGAICTYFGTIVYADRETGRLRHGDAATVPRNLFVIRLGDVVLLARTSDSGGFVAVRMRPQGPHAPRDDWTLWPGAGFARSFTMETQVRAAASTFNLRAAGLFACAEHNGEFTLSRLQAAEWEGFHFQPDTQ